MVLDHSTTLIIFAVPPIFTKLFIYVRPRTQRTQSSSELPPVGGPDFCGRNDHCYLERPTQWAAVTTQSGAIRDPPQPKRPPIKSAIWWMSEINHINKTTLRDDGNNESRLEEQHRVLGGARTGGGGGGGSWREGGGSSPNLPWPVPRFRVHSADNSWYRRLATPTWKWASKTLSCKHTFLTSRSLWQFTKISRLNVTKRVPNAYSIPPKLRHSQTLVRTQNDIKVRVTCAR